MYAIRSYYELRGDERAAYVQRMFGRIAQRYDLMNRLMTVGQDVRWRRELIRNLEIAPNSVVLDLGSGVITSYSIHYTKLYDN